jgi:tRNA threonylcarbamoyladenosine biosynthesis protein TsaE
VVLGKRFAEKLKKGSVVALKGGLGAGKTCLVKGIARGLGLSENITSPTYTIVSEYSVQLNGEIVPLYHIDAYRLNGDEDFENTGAEELMGGGGIAIIEWSERIPRSIPADAITMEIEITGPQSRLFRVYDEPACH